MNRRMLSKEDEAATGGDEVEVRREDQDKINKFSRLHQRELKLEEELKAKNKEKEELDDVTMELELADEDDKVPYKIGDAFFHLPLPQAQEMLASSTSQIEEEVSALEEKIVTNAGSLPQPVAKVSDAGPILVGQSNSSPAEVHPGVSDVQPEWKAQGVYPGSGSEHIHLRGRVVPEQRGLDVGSLTDGVIDGIGRLLSDLPVGSAVQHRLDLSDDDLAALPTQVLNIPGYANWTDEGWNVRIHGNVYKQPDTSPETLDALANEFLIGVDIADLPEEQQVQARNVTASIYIVQQADQSVTINFENDVAVQPNAGTSLINAGGGQQSIKMPYETTPQGDFDAFVTLKNTTGPDGGYLLPGNETASIQALNAYAEGTDSGNATAYLVPREGFTIISDIDDILRVTRIYLPNEGILNTFARPFRPWENMPEIYALWSATIPDVHFHYLTTTPEQVTRNYMEFIYKTYPLGSFDTRPLNFSDIKATTAIRRFLLDKIFATFPERRFVLVGDVSNADIMKAYPQLAKDYPEQVQCIFLRNTTATDGSDLLPYDTSGFEGLDQKRYMFFVHPDDLKGSDIIGGNCHNPAAKQNVTFGDQGLLLGAAGSVRWDLFMTATVSLGTVAFMFT
ncbi:hypothetical protein DL764_001048 [Monosporascus ibericus]|uniref:Phosphatidate phosphatase APP1 catalytic domain-containing protein n=1 Tax=Monosporascus ibericus TaxID=155417 RepID=A0A4Q4TTH4_9PEZI|nr:hypothetical protein DL764_001048 [Monosporascus ibericus]